MRGTPATPAHRDYWVILGMTVTALSAAVSSFSGLRSLAVATGWPEPLALLFPLTIDAYAMTATRVWLSRATPTPAARHFARWNAVLAIGLSLIGNAAWHLIAAEVLGVTWLSIVLVGAVPPIVLGLLSHLAVLRGQAATIPVPPSSADRLSSEPRRLGEDQSQDGPQDEDGLAPEHSLTPAAQPHATPGADEQLAAAVAADMAHRAATGRPITRDALRQVLHISTDRATTLLRELKQQAQ